MNHSGDAAEQMVRMTLEGVEVAAKITGSAAKEIALLLIAALKRNDKGSLKLRGRARLNTMLKSGKPLEIYSVKESDLRKFVQGAKEYGIVYCVLRNAQSNPDGLCDILVKADDAPKISRLSERFKFATVDKARIESEIVAEMSAREAAQEKPVPGGSPFGAEPDAPDKDDTEKLLDDLLGSTEGKAEPDAPGKQEPEKPAPSKGGKEQPDGPPFSRSSQRHLPSEPTSDSKREPGGATFSSGAEPTRSTKDWLDELFGPSTPAPERMDKAAKDAFNEPLLSARPSKPEQMAEKNVAPSEPTIGESQKPGRTAAGKPSVKAEIREITAARKSKEQETLRRDARQAVAKPRNAPMATTHKQPQRGKSKSIKKKGSR
jgi:hypothetical protein